ARGGRRTHARAPDPLLPARGAHRRGRRPPARVPPRGHPPVPSPPPPARRRRPPWHDSPRGGREHSRILPRAARRARGARRGGGDGTAGVIGVDSARPPAVLERLRRAPGVDEVRVVSW